MKCPISIQIIIISKEKQREKVCRKIANLPLST
jgi:hypothetical protein